MSGRNLISCWEDTAYGRHLHEVWNLLLLRFSGEMGGPSQTSPACYSSTSFRGIFEFKRKIDKDEYT